MAHLDPLAQGCFNPRPRGGSKEWNPQFWTLRLLWCRLQNPQVHLLFGSLQGSGKHAPLQTAAITPTEQDPERQNRLPQASKSPSLRNSTYTSYMSSWYEIQAKYRVFQGLFKALGIRSLPPATPPEFPTVMGSLTTLVYTPPLRFRLLSANQVFLRLAS